MTKKTLFAILLLVGFTSGAAWYWPFSGDDANKPPRVSELMELASVMIDEAYDLAGENKVSEAVERFRAALAELDRIEAENPDRVQSPEFNTLKNKRATVTAAIDSLLLSQAQGNAKAIAVTDTTELQKKFDAKHGRAPAAENAAPAAGAAAESVKPVARAAEASEQPKAPKSRMQTALDDLRKRDFAAVELTVKELLEEKPNDAAALNLKAAAEMARGDKAAAEKTLDQAITSNPRSYFAYYNMARLLLRAKGNRSGAKRYYETGRRLGGPVDATLEGQLK